jgi:hypothetical protein
MNTKRKWETIKEYEDIFFDYFDGIGKLPLTASATGMRSGQPR